MRIVAALAAVGLVALVIAVLTGSTWAAAVVIVAASAGIVVLLRDWRTERMSTAMDRVVPTPSDEPDDGAVDARLTPDDFSPDLSTDPDGPSSDARAD